MDEQSYERGSLAAWRNMLAECLRQLGVNDPAANTARWVGERMDAVAALRRVCERHGDNDWPDNLHLGDVIDKHLGNYLESEEDKP